MSESLTAALAQAAQPAEIVTIMGLIERQKPELTKLLESPAAVERLGRTVLTELRRNPKLYECDPASLLGSLMLAAQLGLEPGPLGHVYLVPFKREVTFIVGYKGLIELAFRSGQVKDVAAEVVREGDEFSYSLGTTPRLVHVPSGPPEDRDWIAVYAVARLRTGGAPFRVLYPSDVEAARKRSEAAKRKVGPWETDREAMWRKTAVRRLAAFLPQSAQLARGLAVDEHAARWLEGAPDGELEVSVPDGE